MLFLLDYVKSSCMGEMGKCPIGLFLATDHHSCSRFRAHEALTGKVIPVYARKPYGAVEVPVGLFLASVLDGGER